jgi:quercetin dioxygenase-like cupin family protein
MERQMDRAQFEAELRRDGYEIVDKAIGPGVDRPPHAHDFDARILVLEGVLGLSVGDERRSYAPGQDFVMPAGVTHAEHTGEGGARFLLRKRARA